MIDHAELDPQWFKAFYWAARELSFTAAARRAGMTQSGVSQHIARIEAELNASVFERVNKQVHLTRAGELLLQYIESRSEATTRLREAITAETRLLSGEVAYAMPHSCLFTPHFPMLLKERRREFEAISVRVQLCPNEQVVEKLLDRRLDFGFVTRRMPVSGVRHQPFAREEYALVGTKRFVAAQRSSADDILVLPFVDHPGMGELLETWRDARFPRSRSLIAANLRVAGRINSLHGAVTMVLVGVGCSIMPTHCVEPWLGQGRILRLDPPGARVESEIYIVTRELDPLPARVRRVLDAFMAMRKT